MSLSRIFYLTVQIPRTIFHQDHRSTLELTSKSLAFPCGWCGNRLCHQPEAKQGLCNMAAWCKSLLSLSCLILSPFPAAGAISNGTAAVFLKQNGTPKSPFLLLTCLLDYYKCSEFRTVCYRQCWIKGKDGQQLLVKNVLIALWLPAWFWGWEATSHFLLM